MILEFQKVYEAMQKLFLLLEEDLKKWVREALREEVSLLLETRLAMQANQADGFLTRKEAAQFLRISLVTLHDWMNRGLPAHRKRGRVLFLKSEIFEWFKNFRMDAA